MKLSEDWFVHVFCPQKKVCYYVDECLKLNSVSFPGEHVSISVFLSQFLFSLKPLLFSSCMSADSGLCVWI